MMIIKKHSLLVVLSLSIPLLMSTHLAIFGQEQDSLQVQTHSSEYTTGDSITISGNTTSIIGEPLAQIQILDPNGNVYESNSVQVSPDGSFLYNTIVGGRQGVNGTYQVVVSYDEQQSETAFEFETSGNLLNITIDDEHYDVRAYTVSDDASWLDVTTDTESQSVVIGFSASEPDTLKMELDRTLIDTISNCYLVHIDDELVDSTCVAINSETVLLTLQIPSGSHELRITGSTLVPEFGILTGVILAVSLVGTIVGAKRRQMALKE